MYVKKKLLLLVGMLAFHCTIFAQEQPAMADAMRDNGKIYVVVAVVVTVFLVFFAYLVTIDMKMKKLERKLKDRKG